MSTTKISVSVTILVLTTLLYGCTYGGQPPAANPATPSTTTNPPPTTTPTTPTGAPVPIPPAGTTVQQNPATPAGQGVWTTSLSLMPINPVHGILLNTGNVLYVAGSGNCPPAMAGCPTGGGSATIWNPSTGAFKTLPLPFDAFCNGATQMADGRVFINGGTDTYATGPAAAIMRAMGHGHAVPGGRASIATEATPGHKVPRDVTTAADQGFGGSNLSAIFDPATSTFTVTPPMVAGRWYPTTTLLSDGRVLTYGGQDEKADDDPLIEYWNGSWSAPVIPTCSIGGVVGDCRTMKYSDGSLPVPGAPALYPRMILLPNGKLVHAGPEPETWVFDPAAGAGTANWTYVATNIDTQYRSYGSVVLLPLLPETNYQPVVMAMGGMGNTVVATNTTELIDMSNANPMWVAGPAMSRPRVEMNAVLLPTGRILAVGGSANDEDGATASLTADLYDPKTNSFSSAAPNVYPHLYHSTALLLPDATVVLSGGNPQQGVFEPHIEIYQPAYLFNADGSLATRPSLTGAPGTVAYGKTFTVTSNGTIASAVLIREAAVTHAFDMSQRLVGLSFTANGQTLTLTAPPNGNVAPPGEYLLFLVNTAGVPSLGQVVTVQ
jgi:Domain of unknown function (DUF1929)